ncbi:MAG: type I-U CRISPR-associated RAMP protein Csb1/Cas7u [bacterium]|nr:type I-U CRISPR-associated RAMP protein Csb1/Cas7u [bacterium]MDE0601871.1 type I-U CRISPR-associated RAMP protein Csb1/Cas7u [bacterium]
MPNLTYEQLREATAGGAVALRSRTTLQPAGGKGDKVFPPTYSEGEGRNARAVYAIDERGTVLLDSVASQANRAELALLQGWDMGELEFPVPYVDFSEEIADLGKLTVLEAPHRIADAIFRDSLLGGTLFRLSVIGQAITDATPRNATALFHHSPTALLFGIWDSTGPKGGLGSKFQRAYVSEIVGHDAKIGNKVRSRIDPLQIKKLASDERAYNHQDPNQVWTFNPDEAERDSKGEPVFASRGTESGVAGQPSKINHGNVVPSIDGSTGGVTISKALQTTVLSLAALRRLRFACHGKGAEIAARTAIAALGVAAIAYQYEMDYDLRSRCLLIPEHAPSVELVGRDGSPAQVVSLDRSTAAEILNQAASCATQQGIGWSTSDMRLDPDPKLIELIKRSRKQSATEQPTE